MRRKIELIIFKKITFALMLMFIAITMIGCPRVGVSWTSPDGLGESVKPEEAPIVILKAEDIRKVDEDADSYKIKWTDAKDKAHELEVDGKSDVILAGGLKAGTKATIIPIKSGSEGSSSEVDVPNEDPSAEIDWIEKGITALMNGAYDEGLVCFAKAYKLNPNDNTAKTYYALTELAMISVKPDTVNFIRNDIGLVDYPNKLNALIDTKSWFKDINYMRKIPFSYQAYNFIEEAGANYYCVKAHKKADGEDTSGKIIITINNRNDLYEKSTISGTDQWLDYGITELHDKIMATSPENREDSYSFWGEPFTSFELVIDPNDCFTAPANGDFFLSTNALGSALTIPAETKKYSKASESKTSRFFYEKPAKVSAPEVQNFADWYKDFNPFMRIPAAIIQNYGSNADALIDKLYDLVFAAEFNEAGEILASLDVNKTVNIDKRFIELLGLTGTLGEDDFELNGGLVKGFAGALLIARGAFEYIQSYQFKTEVSFLTKAWKGEEFDIEVLKEELKDYDPAIDPLKNGFMTARNPKKMEAAKNDIVTGIEFIIPMYDTFLNDPSMPEAARDTLKKYQAYKDLVISVKNAIKNGSTVDMLAGENNPLKEIEDLKFTTFTVDMGKFFTAGQLDINKLVVTENGKPKLIEGPEDPFGAKMTLMLLDPDNFIDGLFDVAIDGKSVLDFIPEDMKITKEMIDADPNDAFTDDMEGLMIAPIPGEAGEILKSFYK